MNRFVWFNVALGLVAGSLGTTVSPDFDSGLEDDPFMQLAKGIDDPSVHMARKRSRTEPLTGESALTAFETTVLTQHVFWYADHDDAEILLLAQARHPELMTRTNPAIVTIARTRLNLNTAVPLWFHEKLVAAVHARFHGMYLQAVFQLVTEYDYALDADIGKKIAAEWISRCVHPSTLHAAGVIPKPPCYQIGNKVVLAPEHKMNLVREMVGVLSPPPAVTYDLGSSSRGRHAILLLLVQEPWLDDKTVLERVLALFPTETHIDEGHISSLRKLVSIVTSVPLWFHSALFSPVDFDGMERAMVDFTSLFGVPRRVVRIIADAWLHACVRPLMAWLKDPQAINPCPVNPSGKTVDIPVIFRYRVIEGILRVQNP